MLYYKNTQITFAEVPGMICRCFSISGCNRGCEQCHSPELHEEGGEPFDEKAIEKYISEDLLDNGVEVYVLLGEGNDREWLVHMLKHLKGLGVLTCLYSGNDNVEDFVDMYPWIDFLKVGHYDPKKGGIDKETTNQRMYCIEEGVLEDITSDFWQSAVLERKD